MVSKIEFVVLLSAAFFFTTVVTFNDECDQYLGEKRCIIKDYSILCEAFSVCLEEVVNQAVNACDIAEVKALNLTKEQFKNKESEKCVLKELGLMDEDGVCNLITHINKTESMTEFSSEDIHEQAIGCIEQCYEDNADCVAANRCVHKNIMPICYPNADITKLKECYSKAYEIEADATSF
ncbi:hypothetical protein CHUAL_005301 [Chamberlinius hualienensis]